MKKSLSIAFILIGFAWAQNPLLDSLQIVLKNAKHDTIRCRVLNSLVQNEYNDKIWPKYNDQIRQIAEENLAGRKGLVNFADSFYTGYLATYYENYGFYAYYNESNVSKAIDLFNKGMLLDMRIGNKKGIADAYNALAVVYDKQGNVPKAMDYQFKALKIKEELNDKRGTAVVLTNIGGNYLDDNNLQKARECYTKSLKIFEECKDLDGKANSLNALGHIYISEKKLDSALIFYKKALALVEEQGDPIGIAGVLINLGSFYYRYGDPACDSTKENCKKSNLQKAREYYLKGLAINKETGNEGGAGAAKNHLAGIEYKLGNYKEARSLAKEALETAMRLGFPNAIANASELLYLIEKADGNATKALEYYEQYIVMHDSVENKENSKKMIKAQLQYDYAKQKEIDKANNDKELAISVERENKQKLVSIFVGIGLLLVLFFAIFIFNRLRLTNKQKRTIEEKNHVIEEKQKEILDSIHYAKRIQSTILAHTDYLNANLPSNFIYFKPKDIVSGDFYWATKKVFRRQISVGSELQTEDCELFYLAVCDSTGHGVPGAFMSLLNIGFLSEAISEKNIEKPNEIFNYVRERLVNSISKEGQKDGFDGVLLCIDTKTKKITYAAANNDPLIVTGDKLVELPGNRMPVGIGVIQSSFELYEAQLNKGDTLYLFTDGFADQFGGPKGKKYKYKQLNELLKRISVQSIKEQAEVLDKEFENWRGKLDQVDDVCIIGIRL